MNESRVSVPLQVRLQFGHAAVQYVAEEIGAEIVDIQRAAVDPTLRAGHFGTDVDVMVRPDHVASLDHALRRAGWSLYITFENGSPFGPIAQWWPSGGPGQLRFRASVAPRDRLLGSTPMKHATSSECRHHRPSERRYQVWPV